MKFIIKDLANKYSLPQNIIYLTVSIAFTVILLIASILMSANNNLNLHYHTFLFTKISSELDHTQHFLQAYLSGSKNAFDDMQKTIRSANFYISMATIPNYSSSKNNDLISLTELPDQIPPSKIMSNINERRFFLENWERLRAKFLTINTNREFVATTHELIHTSYILLSEASLTYEKNIPQADSSMVSLSLSLSELNSESIKYLSSLQSLLSLLYSRPESDLKIITIAELRPLLTANNSKYKEKLKTAMKLLTDIEPSQDERYAKLLLQIETIHEKLNPTLDQIESNMPTLVSLLSIEKEIFSILSILSETSAKYASANIALADKIILFEYLGTALFIILIILFVMTTRTVHAYLNHLKSSHQSEIHDHNHSLENLNKNIQPLKIGNFSNPIELTNNFLRNIIKSINDIISGINKKISHIQRVSSKLTNSSKEIISVSEHLVKSNETQAQQIIGVAASVNAMASSIEHVSFNASQSSVVAEQSVEIASRGVAVVADMIMGMGQIRHQIQDSAKQIKKLGERSQEIGDMVSLIDDLSDQTNILSLNAAIQAAMAGDAGRGFAVVADEVQRLAERSGHATKEIEDIVRNIQYDTNQAVISMEQTTTEVVEGARLAEDAGVALERIESVSKKLAPIIQSISDEAQQQADTSMKISKNMDMIQKTATETVSINSNTSGCIKEISNISKTLEDAINQFIIK